METYSIKFTKSELRILQRMFDTTIEALVSKQELDAANVVAGIGLKILLPLIKDLD